MIISNTTGLWGDDNSCFNGLSGISSIFIFGISFLLRSLFIIFSAGFFIVCFFLVTLVFLRLIFRPALEVSNDFVVERSREALFKIEAFFFEAFSIGL